MFGKNKKIKNLQEECRKKDEEIRLLKLESKTHPVTGLPNEKALSNCFYDISQECLEKVVDILYDDPTSSEDSNFYDSLQRWICDSDYECDFNNIYSKDEINHIEDKLNLPKKYLAIDLDFLHQWNECYGHASVDKVLETYGFCMRKAQALTEEEFSNIGAQIKIFGFGGDEGGVVINCRNDNNYNKNDKLDNIARYFHNQIDNEMADNDNYKLRELDDINEYGLFMNIIDDDNNLIEKRTIMYSDEDNKKPRLSVGHTKEGISFKVFLEELTSHIDRTGLKRDYSISQFKDLLNDKEGHGYQTMINSVSERLIKHLKDEADENIRFYKEQKKEMYRQNKIYIIEEISQKGYKMVETDTGRYC